MNFPHLHSLLDAPNFLQTGIASLFHHPEDDFVKAGQFHESLMAHLESLVNNTPAVSFDPATDLALIAKVTFKKDKVRLINHIYSSSK